MGFEVSGLITKKDKADILVELKKSTEKHNVLGLFIEGQEEMVTTSVTQVVETYADPVIYLEKTDLHGYPIDNNPVTLSRIRSVIPFNTLFNDAVYVRIRQRRSDHRAA